MISDIVVVNTGGDQYFCVTDLSATISAVTIDGSSSYVKGDYPNVEFNWFLGGPSVSSTSADDYLYLYNVSAGEYPVTLTVNSNAYSNSALSTVYVSYVPNVSASFQYEGGSWTTNRYCEYNSVSGANIILSAYGDISLTDYSVTWRKREYVKGSFRDVAIARGTSANYCMRKHSYVDPTGETVVYYPYIYANIKHDHNPYCVARTNHVYVKSVPNRVQIGYFEVSPDTFYTLGSGQTTVFWSVNNSLSTYLIVGSDVINVSSAGTYTATLNSNTTITLSAVNGSHDIYDRRYVRFTDEVTEEEIKSNFIKILPKEIIRFGEDRLIDLDPFIPKYIQGYRRQDVYTLLKECFETYLNTMYSGDQSVGIDEISNGG